MIGFPSGQRLRTPATAEYVGLARGTSSPSLRAHFARIAEEYMVRADGEMRVAERRQAGPQ